MPTLPEPTWTAPPMPTWTDASALCSTGIRPTIVTGIILRLLQYHFSNPKNIQDPVLQNSLFEIDPKTGTIIGSRIRVKAMYEMDVRNLEQKPAILVRRGPADATKFPLMSKSITHLEANGNYRGEDYYVPIQATHLITCLAEGGMAADRLGEEVFYRMLEFTPAIKNDIKIGDFYVTRMDSPKPLDDSGSTFYVNIQINWNFVHSWTLVPIAPILKKIRIVDDIVEDTSRI